MWIRIDSEVERPEDRGGFKIPDIEQFVRLERPRLLAAVLTIIRAWIDAGRPKWKGQPVGSFERWSETIGGILDVAGVPDFLKNREEMYKRLDPEREKWAGFFEQWFEEHGDKRVGVSDVAGLAWNRDLIDNTERPGRTALGTMLRARIDSLIGGWRLKSAAPKSGAAQYQVTSIPEPNSVSREPSEPYEPTLPYTQDISEDSKDMYTGLGVNGSQGSLGSRDSDDLDDLTDPFADGESE